VVRAEFFIPDCSREKVDGVGQGAQCVVKFSGAYWFRLCCWIQPCMPSTPGWRR